MGEQYDLVVVANRLPVDRVTDADGSCGWRPSPGGLVTALQPVVAERRGAWIGWPGDVGSAPDPLTVDGMRLHPVPLDADEVAGYYEGQSNATIWPLYHDAVEQSVFRRDWRAAYREVNERFARAAADLAAPGAVVWVHDYQLQLVPGMLRALRPDLRIGFFLHIPFPPIELFMRMPLRTEIMQGLLGADLVGFQRPGGARNFLRLARRLLGLQPAGNRVGYDGRTVTVGAFPISIGVAEFEALADDPTVQTRAKEIRAELGDPDTVLLGVDRLDYTKGIEHRLLALGELLEGGQLSSPGSVLVQVATPTRERIAHYRDLRDRVNGIVGRINGDHGRVGQPAVHYLYQSLPRRELVALYLAADVMVVTPLRDGMNLVAKEYVATRLADDGALVLSEFAGAADELPQAYLVNPYDVDALKETIVHAVHAGPAERARRMRAMRRHLRAHDVDRWADTFLTALGAAHR
ncbi:trehalose-6-phosphate synthase [Planosporangium thailandense]|uniref:Trehalose-6-phosphate synthase n=1 Tax=Planosporangium thailandense TaxID=765197 RepID=A0ABX0Y1C3_9ACTN|nr:trehalose-6-phosphate synthase [Planosporangium thailandense]NJC71213.1 trehalose-6-phosphate synthase [Planosporangium thailandense]